MIKIYKVTVSMCVEDDINSMVKRVYLLDLVSNHYKSLHLGLCISKMLSLQILTLSSISVNSQIK